MNQSTNGGKDLKKVMKRDLPILGRWGEEVKRRFSSKLDVEERTVKRLFWVRNWTGTLANDEYLSSSLNTNDNAHTRISISKQIVYLALRKPVQRDCQMESKGCSRGEKGQVLESSEPRGKPWENPPKALPDSVQHWIYPSRQAGHMDASSQ